VESSRLLQRLAVVAAAFVLGGVLAATAWASYWEWSGNIPEGNGYSEYGGAGGPITWQIRLSRELCGTKMVLGNPDTRYQVPIPGGCSNSDYTYPYDSVVWHWSSCYNADGPTMWVNCRVDPNM
jgi:hypothetical protein